MVGCCSGRWPVFFTAIGRWSVVGYFYVNGRWSVVGVTVVGGRWSVVGGWSVGGAFVLRRSTIGSKNIFKPSFVDEK